MTDTARLVSFEIQEILRSTDFHSKHDTDKAEKAKCLASLAAALYWLRKAEREETSK